MFLSVFPCTDIFQYLIPMTLSVDNIGRLIMLDFPHHYYYYLSVRSSVAHRVQSLQIGFMMNLCLHRLPIPHLFICILAGNWKVKTGS